MTESSPGDASTRATGPHGKEAASRPPARGGTEPKSRDDSYLAMLLHPKGRLPWAGAFLGRIVLGMLVVSIVLLFRRTGQSYGVAGTAAAMTSIGVAIGTPLWGRLVDRRGPVRLLRLLAAGFAVGTTLLSFAAVQRAPVAVLYALATAAGFAFPPVSAVARVGWRRLYGQQLRDRAFALDSVTVELGFVLGPILAAALVDGVAVWSGLVVSGLLMLIGVVMFTASPLATGIGGEPTTMRGGAVRVRAVRSVMMICALIAIAFGTIDIVAPAVAEAAGRPGLTGFILGAFALGSAVGGFVYGSRMWPGTRVGRLQLMAVIITAGMGVLSLGVDRLVLFVIMAMATGLLIAPMIIISFALVDDLAPDSVVTEAIAWVNTAFTVGAAVGSSVAGRLVDSLGIRQAVLGGAVGLGCAALAVALLRPSITRDEHAATVV